MRKEYNDRHNAPLVNPAITHGEYEARKAAETKTAAPKPAERVKNLFTPTIDGIPARAS